MHDSSLAASGQISRQSMDTYTYEYESLAWLPALGFEIVTLS